MRTLELLPILLLALSSNADNVGVGLAYGFRRINVSLGANFLIALVTGASTIAAMIVGQSIGRSLQPKLAAVLGGAIIAGIGGWVILHSAKSGSGGGRKAFRATALDRSPTRAFTKLILLLDNPLSLDRDFSGTIDMKEGCLLAVALSLNNVINGLAAGMVGLSPTPTTIAVMIFSMLTLWTGVAAGNRYGQRWLGSFAELVSGLLLVVIGVYEIWV